MTFRFRLVAYVLVGVLGLSALTSAETAPTVASQADLDAAVTKALGQEDAARQTITTLLHRDDVRRMAAGYRLDLRRVDAAVATLQGDELQRLSRVAATADARLAGGDDTVATIAGVVLLIVLTYGILLLAVGVKE